MVRYAEACMRSDNLTCCKSCRRGITIFSSCFSTSSPSSRILCSLAAAQNWCCKQSPTPALLVGSLANTLCKRSTRTSDIPRLLRSGILAAAIISNRTSGISSRMNRRHVSSAMASFCAMFQQKCTYPRRTESFQLQICVGRFQLELHSRT